MASMPDARPEGAAVPDVVPDVVPKSKGDLDTTPPSLSLYTYIYIYIFMCICIYDMYIY